MDFGIKFLTQNTNVGEAWIVIKNIISSLGDGEI